MRHAISLFRTKANQASYYVLLAAVFSLSFSTAALNILFPLTILLMIVGNQWSHKWQIIKTNPLTPWIVLLFGIYCLGTLYSSAPWQARIDELAKYRKLLFIPLLMPLLVEHKWRVRVVAAFLAASLAILMLSYLQYFNLILINDHFGLASIFKGHSTVNLLMAIACYLTLQAAHMYKKYFWWWMMYAILAVIFVIFLNGGRVGYLVIVALLFLYGWQYYRWRGVILGALLLILLFGAAYKLPTEFAQRTHETVKSLQHENQQETATSIRAQEAEVTWKIIKAHPIFGVGTAAYPLVYQQVTPYHDYTDNAQTQYLQTWVELGTVGLIIFLIYIMQQWRLGLRLAKPWNYLAYALVLSQLIASVSLTILSDTTESHFFALFIALCFASLSTKDHHRVSD